MWEHQGDCPMWTRRSPIATLAILCTLWSAELAAAQEKNTAPPAVAEAKPGADNEAANRALPQRDEAARMRLLERAEEEAEVQQNLAAQRLALRRAVLQRPDPIQQQRDARVEAQQAMLFQ